MPTENYEVRLVAGQWVISSGIIALTEPLHKWAEDNHISYDLRSDYQRIHKDGTVIWMSVCIGFDTATAAILFKLRWG